MKNIPFYHKCIKLSFTKISDINRNFHWYYDEISNYSSLKSRFYAYYRLHYYIAGIPYAWHSSLWSAGMAIMPMYIRVTYQKIRYLGHLWKFDRKWMQVSYQLFMLLSCCEITWSVSQEIPNCRPQFSKINIVNQGRR